MVDVDGYTALGGLREVHVHGLVGGIGNTRDRWVRTVEHDEVARLNLCHPERLDSASHVAIAGIRPAERHLAGEPGHHFGARTVLLQLAADPVVAGAVDHVAELRSLL